MADIFSRNLIERRPPAREPRANHYHIRPDRGTADDQLPSAYRTTAKALANCPDGFGVWPCRCLSWWITPTNIRLGEDLEERR